MLAYVILSLIITLAFNSYNYGAGGGGSIFYITFFPERGENVTMCIQNQGCGSGSAYIFPPGSGSRREKLEGKKWKEIVVFLNKLK